MAAAYAPNLCASNAAYFTVALIRTLPFCPQWYSGSI